MQHHNFALATTASDHHTPSLDYLRQEVVFLETRLQAMGDEGDCAYERALSRVYHVILRERRSQLQDLSCALPA